MANKSVTAQRWLVGVIACLALATFFLPLISLRAPLVGEQEASGYNVASKISQFKKRLSESTGADHGKGRRGRIQLPGSGRSSRGWQMPNLPLSVKLAWLTPVFIIGAFLCGFITLLGAFVSVGISKIGSTCGAVLASAAILHLHLMNSNIHGMFQQSVNSGVERLQGSPFATMVQALGKLLVNAFHLEAGIGLYVLTGALTLIAVLTLSRILVWGRSGTARE